MVTLLHLDSSGQSESSVTRKLSSHFAEKWQEANPGGRVIYRDLTSTNVPFASEALIFAMNTPPEKLTAAQKLLLALPDELAKELLEADTYVLGVPMYNFSVPAVFKAYLDTIVRAGITFSFEGGYPQGLLKNKKVFVVSASGSDFSQPPLSSMDFLEPYIRAIFSFIGLTDVTFFKANGHNEAEKSASLSTAKSSISSHFQPVVVS